MDFEELKRRVEQQKEMRKLLVYSGILVDKEGRRYRVIHGDPIRPIEIILDPLDHDALYRDATRRVIRDPEELSEYKMVLPT
jgi:hypothetical protein